MSKKLDLQIQAELDAIREAGLFKRERTITSPQGAEIDTIEGGEVLNFCANNYLGLSSHHRMCTGCHSKTNRFLVQSRMLCGF